MEFKSLVSGVLAVLVMVPAYGHDIYKCNVNGTVHYSEQKCNAQSKPVTLKALAAPGEKVDVAIVKGQEDRTKADSLKAQINRHQKRISKYRTKMQYELGMLKKKAGMDSDEPKRARHNNWEKESSSQLKKISASTDRSIVAEQMTAVVNHYKVLIEVEEFQIGLLYQELKMNNELRKLTK